MPYPEQRYANDADYHTCVDTLEMLLQEERFSPSELREIAVLACIHYDRRVAMRSYATADLGSCVSRAESTGPKENPPLVYLACPYSHPDPAVRQERFEAVNRYATELYTSGLVVFSPISHSHPLCEHGLPGNFEFWERLDRLLLDICDRMIVLCLDGWDGSVGVAAEIVYFESAGKRVEFRMP